MAYPRRKLPSQARLRELFDYDPGSGLFTRRIDRGSSVKTGATAGWNCGGYLGIGVDGKWYLAHVLAWVYMVGECPEMIDHRDGNGLNNIFSNLRPCNKSNNAANAKIQSNNTSGFKGVSWNKGKKKWEAYICLRKKTFLGRFGTKEEAAAAYRNKAIELFGEFARVQ